MHPQQIWKVILPALVRTGEECDQSFWNLNYGILVLGTNLKLCFTIQDICHLMNCIFPVLLEYAGNSRHRRTDKHALLINFEDNSLACRNEDTEAAAMTQKTLLTSGGTCCLQPGQVLRWPTEAEDETGRTYFGGILGVKIHVRCSARTCLQDEFGELTLSKQIGDSF